MDLSGSSGIAISGLPAAHKRPCGRLLRKARRSCPPPTINRYSAYILAAKFYDYRTLPKQIASPSRLRALQRKRSHLTPSFREHGQRTVQQSGRTRTEGQTSELQTIKHQPNAVFRLQTKKK